MRIFSLRLCSPLTLPRSCYNPGLMTFPGGIMDYQFIADLKEMAAAVPSDSIISRQLVKQDGSEAILFVFDTGQGLSEHTASRPAMLYFVQGQARLTLGEDEMDVGPGAWAYMPAKLPHSIAAQTAVTMLLIMLPAAA